MNLSGAVQLSPIFPGTGAVYLAWPRAESSANLLGHDRWIVCQIVGLLLLHTNDTNVWDRGPTSAFCIVCISNAVTGDQICGHIRRKHLYACSCSLPAPAPASAPAVWPCLRWSIWFHFDANGDKLPCSAKMFRGNTNRCIYAIPDVVYIDM